MSTCDNTRPCPCTANCERHGKCCDCVAHHRDKRQLPGCFFSTEGEALYDRSLSVFLKDRGITE
ncbi:hypothetical protein [Eubacterium aggregans]|uniref:hypothetical protein n=1 Tax=Eubacterium aggregans TaxID=81409 RepID=UPI003F2DD7A4